MWNLALFLVSVFVGLQELWGQSMFVWLMQVNALDLIVLESRLIKREIK